MKRSSRGFTLTEIVIVVAIIGILAAIAYPSYDSQITRSKRADAMAALTNAAQAMERFRVNNYSYNVPGSDISVVFSNQVPTEGGTPYYTLSLQNVTATTYTLVATPVNSMAGKDGPLTLTESGARTWTDKDGVLHNCWPTESSTC